MSGHATNTTGGGGSIPGIDNIQRLALLAGIVGLAAAAGLGLLNGWAGFARSYLYAYLFWLGLPIASIGLLCINHLAGGTWGILIRRLLESSAATIALMAILAIPLLSPPSLNAVYPWAQPAASVQNHDAPAPAPAATESAPAATEHAATEHASPAFVSRLGHKTAWFARGFFYARAVGYFVLWGLLAFILNRWSADQDRARDLAPTQRLRTLGAPGLILLFLSSTLALVDWSMSLDPNWYSTIYGAMLLIGAAQATLAFTLIVLSRLVDHGYYKDLLTSSRLRDLGNLLLALTMLWAYTSFSQFLIMWSGNLAEEVPWYLKRSHNGWQFVVGFLMAAGFFLPFVALLFRGNKQSTSRLRNVATFILLIHVVDLYWIVGPDLGYANLTFPLQPLAALVGVGGLWLAAYTFFLKGKAQLLPENDPYLVDLREYDQAHAHGHAPHPA